ncbi:response regulator transcription factor [Anaerotruncus colihominis]|uniref:Stage 0 sporulation protein A homolog n=1 Tax=Anaerotruncus colihominis TaxID=169435 RepID=A0A845ST51_9FIRM|nr:response regulator transcription factor [Anaerotruncus colihominis]MCR2025594.1 response regulator transcription factor [Anaerotruncus colihominis]NDO39696.1 response regulator transcription factor [Anaerotruncus colihominis]
MKRILVVEDEDVIRDFEVINLKRAGYEVVDVPTGEEAIQVFERNPTHFDVAVLDVMMPGMDGFEVCRRIREKNSSIGIIMLTAKSQEMDKVNGLMIGADDYVTKPFSPSELVARVDALHRRVTVAAEKAQAPAPSELKSGPFMLNMKSRTVSKNGRVLELTQVEYQILEYFFNNPNTALGRQDILNKVWGEGYFGDIKIVDVNIRRLRMKLEDAPSKPEFLLTVWGFGYKWVQK